jgi:non-ribosomal peptide synthetase component F
MDRANAVADSLRSAGVRTGEAVGVMFSRSVDCVAAMLGVVLADGVYVPIALEDPEPHRERLLDLLAVRLLLHGTTASGVALTTREAEGLVVPGRAPDDAGASPLYVMFTSGSTGEPKAVVVSHRSVIRLVRDPWFVGFSNDDGVGFASNPGFDAATWEVWGALCNGHA